MKVIEQNRTIIIEEEYKVQKGNTTYTIWMKLNSDGYIQDFSINDGEGYIESQYKILEEFLDASGLDYLY